MKKITLSVGLLAAILSTKAQDTTCTYFKGKRVLEFDYKTSEIMYEQEHNTKFFDIIVEYGNVLCLDLSDDKNRLRKVKTTFFDGNMREDILNSTHKVYYSPQGTVKVSVSKPRWGFFSTK
jgi:hypothetical protein